MDSFYMTLPSNVKNDHFDNTVANFKTNLAQRMSLKGDWEVGLAGISYTNSWYNFQEEQTIEVIYYDHPSDQTSGGVGLPKKKKFYLPAGRYDKIDDLLNLIEFQWTKFTNENSNRDFVVEVDSKGKVRRTFSLYTKQMIVSVLLPKIFKRDAYFSFSQKLCHALGFDKAKLDKYIGDQMLAFTKSPNDPKFLKHREFNTMKGHRPFEIGHIFYGLYVYCDLVYPTFVGDTLSQLLRFVEIPPGTSYGDQIVLSYPDTHYLRLYQNEFGSIEIDIKDEYGSNFPFEFGRSIIILHFRKSNKSSSVENEV